MSAGAHRLRTRSFTARRMAELRPRVRRHAEELLDVLATGGPVDLIAHNAALLPIRVICELLGVPQGDREEFTVRLPRALDGALLSALVEVSQDEDRLSVDELVAMAMLLLIAGHETTVDLIGNAMFGLLTHPDQLALLAPGPGLLPLAVEPAGAVPQRGRRGRGGHRSRRCSRHALPQRSQPRRRPLPRPGRAAGRP